PRCRSALRELRREAVGPGGLPVVEGQPGARQGGRVAGVLGRSAAAQGRRTTGHRSHSFWGRGPEVRPAREDHVSAGLENGGQEVSGQTSEVVLRDGRPDDVESVLVLWRQAGATPSVTDSVAALGHVIEDGPAFLLLAEVDGLLVGSLIGSF